MDDPDDPDLVMDEASAAVITSSIEANLREEGGSFRSGRRPNRQEFGGKKFKKLKILAGGVDW